MEFHSVGSYKVTGTGGIRADNWHLLKQMDDAELLLQNRHNLSFKIK